MGRELREFFPDHAGKGSLISSYKAETGLLWMSAASLHTEQCLPSVNPVVVHVAATAGITSSLCPKAAITS